MTKSHLPRRAVASAASAVVLVGGGVAAFAAGEAGGLGLPTAGCNTISDPKGDGRTGSDEAPVPTVAPNDPDLDITGVVFGTSPTAVSAVIRVDKLGTAPSPGIGHYWIVNFMAAGKLVDFSSNRLIEPLQTAYNAGFIADSVKIGGTRNATIKLTAVYDTKNSLVILSADRPALEKALGAPLAGTDLSKLHAESGFHVVSGYESADLADATAPFTVDSNPCFGAAPEATGSPAPSASGSPSPQPSASSSASPAKTTLSNTGATRAQYGDTAALAAKLVDGSNAPVSGKTVTFTLGSATATGTTDANGVARASLPMKSNAGSYALKETWAGDSSAGASSTSVNFTEAVEVTRTALTIAKSGASRTATATVLDDDRHAVSGQVVTFYVNNKKVATVRTSSKGQAAYKGAKPGQTVKSVLGAVAGKYATSSATAKA